MKAFIASLILSSVLALSVGYAAKTAVDSITHVIETRIAVIDQGGK